MTRHLRWGSELALALGVSVAACGGQSVRHDAAGMQEDGSAASSGTSGTGGSALPGTGGTGGAGGSASPGTPGSGASDAVVGYGCGSWEGDPIRPGQTTYDPRFCETCTCHASTGNGNWISCERCDATCEVEGGIHPLGNSYVEDDGCTVCRCVAQGWECDASVCEREARCRELPVLYAAAVQDARRCEPAVQGQCGVVVTSSLACGCPTAVSDATEARALAEEWKRTCDTSKICIDTCPPPSSAQRCSAEGLCIPM
jgi:hypothetical protein